jgi:hypothetical protein
MFAFPLLGSPLANDMLDGNQVPVIGAPAVSVIAAYPEGRE